MDLTAVIIMVVCLLGYSISWKLQSHNKFTLAVLLLFILGLGLRIFTSTDWYLHAWDERYHALVAKNLMGHPLIPTLYENPVLPYNYMDWTSNHIWLHKQPIPLWSMALSFKLFGLNEMALRVPSILLSSTGIILMYHLGKTMFSKRIGFVAAFLFSIHGLIIELTAGRVATDHYDAFFVVLILLTIYAGSLLIKTNKLIFGILAGIVLGLAILTKWLPALISLPVIGLLFIHEKKYTLKQITLFLSLISGVTLIVVLPWQLYVMNQFPREFNWEQSFNIKHLTTTLEGQGGPFYYHLDKLRIIYGELIYLPMLWLIYTLFRKRQRVNFKLIAMGVWIIIPVLFFSIAKTKMQAYTLFVAPAIFLLTAYFVNYLQFTRKSVKYTWLNTIFAILLILLPIRYSFERIKFFNHGERSPLWVQTTKDFGAEHQNEKGVIFNVEEPIETMFYTDFTAYSFLPDTRVLDSLKIEGYKVYINQPFEKDRINFVEY